MRILIMGLPGSGKTTFSEKLASEISQNMPIETFDANVVRTQLQDFDFTLQGCRRQAERMRDLATVAEYHKIVPICNFVCPTKEFREIFDPTILIWLDTIKESKFKDTNQMFEPPVGEYDFCITSYEDFSKMSRVIADLAWILEE